MKAKPKISVCILTKGVPLSLGKVLQGYMKQTVKPHETVVVGSKVDIKALKVKIDLGRKIKFIEFSGDKNDGRNIGLLKTSGDYFLYSDNDMIPQKDLIEKCTQKAEEFEAIIIPEYGVKTGGFLEKIYSLEKNLVNSDSNAITPRLFKRSLFKNGDMPFDKKFGVLDEWGFNLRLISKKPSMTTVNSSFTIIDKSSLIKRLKKNYEKGLWVKNLVKDNLQEGLRRVNPIKRGIKFYSSKSHYFKKTPIIFILLLLVKLLDFIAFYLGFFVSFLKKYYSDDADKLRLSK